MKFKQSKGVIATLIAVLVIALSVVYVKSISKAASSSSAQVDVDAPLKTASLNREFTFPIKDPTGTTLASVKYVIDTAELRDQIIVKGQKATAIKGREFLVLNLKLSNDSDKGIDLNTRDYVRLSVNGDEKNLLAPDIHNDPVEVQPISTKYTKLGFPINETDKNLKLFVGEIDATKSAVLINF
jgi:hypothetical protein